MHSNYFTFRLLLTLLVVAALVVVAPLRAQAELAQPAQQAAAPDAAPAPPTVAPETVTEPEVAVDELLRRALANNPQLPIARQTQEAARQRLGALRSFPSPTLELVPGVGDREARDEEVLLSQPLDVFGRRRAQAKVAGAELRRAQAGTMLAERTLVVSVKNAAAELFAAQEAEHLGQVQVEVARLFRNAAARKAELGDAPPVQAQRADLELLRAQNELTNTQAERLIRRAALNQLIGQAPQEPLRVALPRVALPPGSGLADLLRVRPGAPLTPQPPLPNLGEGVPSLRGGGAPPTPLLSSSSQVGSNLVGLRAQLLPNALSNRPDVVGAQATLEARQAQVAVTRRERLPQIELQARRSSFFGREGSYALRAVVTLPLFDFGSLKRERRAVEAEVRAQQATIALLRSQVAAQVEQALIRLQQQRQTVERYRTGIVPLTVELLRKTQIGYAAGASTYLEVLEAQRTLRQVQTEYLQAIVGARMGEAALEGALGATLPAELPMDVSSALANPTGPATPPGVAAPGTVPPFIAPPAPTSPAPIAPTTENPQP